MFNKSKFKAKIVENNLSLAKVAELLGINEATLHRKMNGVSDFSRSEIQLLRQILNMSSNESEEIFFAVKLA